MENKKCLFGTDTLPSEYYSSGILKWYKHINMFQLEDAFKVWKSC